MNAYTRACLVALLSHLYRPMYNERAEERRLLSPRAISGATGTETVRRRSGLRARHPIAAIPIP